MNVVSDDELYDLQASLGLGIPVAWIRTLLNSLGAEGDLMEPDKVRTLLSLWCDFSCAYCASWMVVDRETLGNFAGWLINSNKVGAP